MHLTFGQKIKEARKHKQLTQRKLAELIGAKHNSVSDWELDKNRPDPDTIELLCGVLEITPNYLLDSPVSEESFSLFEKNLIKKYRVLDEHGKDMVDTVLNKEYDRCTYSKITEISQVRDDSSGYLAPEAAHERTDIPVTDEMKAHDDDIMDNF